MPFKHIAQMALSIAAIAAAVFACSSADAKKGRDDLQEIVRSGSSTGGSGTSDGTSDDRVRHDSSSSSRADDSTAARRDGDTASRDVARAGNVFEQARMATPPGFGSNRTPGDRF